MVLQFNMPALLTAAASTLVIGYVWYHPKVFGTASKKATGMTPESGKGMNMGLLLLLTFVFAFMSSIILNNIVIHHWGLFSVLAGDPGFMQEDPNSEAYKYFNDFMGKYGDRFRTFKHGSFHGILLGLFMALPIIGTHAIYERRGFKYIAITAGYWVVSFAIMGGIICAWR